MSKRHLEDEPEVTAQPKRVGDELRHSPVSEEGLAIDPDDLGRQFLTDATHQGNFESQVGGDTPELSITEGASSDDPLVGPNFEGDHDVWENTVDLSLQEGSPETVRREASTEGTDQNQGIGDDAEDELDLTQDAIHEASLLDREGEEFGETEEPELTTDDSHHYNARRARRTGARRI